MTPKNFGIIQKTILESIEDLRQNNIAAAAIRLTKLSHVMSDVKAAYSDYDLELALKREGFWTEEEGR